MKDLRQNAQSVPASAFTLVEVALALGVAAGTILLLFGLLSGLARDVQRVKEPEATSFEESAEKAAAFAKSRHWPMPDEVLPGLPASEPATL